jgi:uncharacterized protein with LGFP repeats
MSMVDHIIWAAAGGGELNTDGAIYKLWNAYREEGNYLGVPLAPETAVSDTEVQQPFSSGAVIAWDPVNGARLV